ncbi:hypothetical protein EDC56_2423 [Sinobacterium caligoides]|uniref:Uncharacterized protein n=1 Tax=Sinobacterium caligoides TaxID=933926 RepID=A0A3N2DQ62_9GAMM|nr:kinase [Sinobacterium caligoides]ROS01974.1 hypothetical protein EDC56_2423 [Sinobacterium caligoides]
MKSDPKYYVLTAILTVLVTVFVLDFYGYIRHSDSRDGAVVAEYSSLILEPGEEFRMSPKKSQHRALCIKDFIVVDTTTPDGKQIRSLLMDSKKRGLPCSN